MDNFIDMLRNQSKNLPLQLVTPILILFRRSLTVIQYCSIGFGLWPLNQYSKKPFFEQQQQRTEVKQVNMQQQLLINYLNGKLTEEAICAIAGLAMSEENYNIVIKILKDKFEDQQYLIDLR
jgi:hypothetical protein